MYDKMIFKKYPNWNLEVLGILRLCYSDSIENVIKKLEKSPNSKTKLYLNKILKYKEASYDDVINIVENKYSNLLPYIRVISDAEKDDMEDECKVKEKHDLSIIESLVLYYNVFKCESDEEIDDIMKLILNIYREEYIHEDKEYEFNTLDNILQFFIDSKLQDRAKLMFIEFYLNRYNFVKQINEMQDEIMLICKENFNIVENEYLDYCNMVSSSNKYFNELSKFYSLDIELPDKTNTYISIGFFNNMSIRYFEKDALIYIGICVLDLCIDGNRNKDETTISDLKVISDNTRFKILRSLKEKEKYLQELADELKLTPATISHHINILLGQSFIGAKINTDINKRIIYFVSKDKINSLIESLSNLFNDK